VAGAVSTTRDVTEQRLAESALAEERQRLAITLRSIGDGVIATDAQARVTIVNRAAEAMTGWLETEAVGRPLSDVFCIYNELTGARVPDPVGRVLETGQVQGLANHTVLVSRQGGRYILADSAAPIVAESGETVGVVLVFQDVTERHYLEEERAKVNKLESLGVLAGGIAHDFNNLLTGILGNIVLARSDVEDRVEVRDLLREAEQASLRAKGLTQQLLTFARGGEPVKRPVSLPALLQDATTFALRGSGVTPRFDLPPDVWPVQADPGQLAQVVQNLVINARDAMAGRGVVTVAAHNLTLTDAESLPLLQGPYVRVTVADEGHGIPGELKSRIFDPYFTTKQKGSGLGLAVVYSVVVKHDGYVTVESEVDRGSSFHVYLPALAGEGPTAPPALPTVPHKARVLVMDDEEIVLRVAKKMLERLGYEAVIVTGGSQAVTLYREATEAGRGFDAVILDLYVPGGMGGTETLSRLRTIDPEVRAIVSSGYSSDRVMAQYAAYGFVAAMDKPYSMETLRTIVSMIVSG
jgi:two-component system, cell cycle sensor histidine kinase and response regulator CckA